MSGGFVIDTPEGIEAYRLLATHKGLEIEMRTQQAFGSPANFLTRGLALSSARRIIEQYRPEWPRPRSRKAAHTAMGRLLDELGVKESHELP